MTPRRRSPPTRFRPGASRTPTVRSRASFNGPGIGAKPMAASKHRGLWYALVSHGDPVLLGRFSSGRALWFPSPNLQHHEKENQRASARPSPTSTHMDPLLNRSTLACHDGGEIGAAAKGKSSGRGRPCRRINEARVTPCREIPLRRKMSVLGSGRLFCRGLTGRLRGGDASLRALDRARSLQTLPAGQPAAASVWSDRRSGTLLLRGQ